MGIKITLYHMPGYWSKTQKSQIVVPRAGNKLKMLLHVQLGQMAHDIKNHYENMGLGAKRRWSIFPKSLKFGTN